MKSRNLITEEDLLVTEALIAESYGRMKKSVIQAPSRALTSVGGTIKSHPFAAAGTAVAAGIVAYELIRLITPRAVSEETEYDPRIRSRSEKRRPDLMMEVLSMIMPLAVPYITDYLKKYMGRIFQRVSD